MSNKSRKTNKIKKHNKKESQINILKSKLNNINNKKNSINSTRKLSKADLIKRSNLGKDCKLIKKEINNLKSSLIKDDIKKRKGIKTYRPSSKTRKKLSAAKRK